MVNLRSAFQSMIVFVDVKTFCFVQPVYLASPLKFSYFLAFCLVRRVGVIADDSQETMISHCKIVRVMNRERVNTIFLLLCHRGSIIMRNIGEIEKQKGQCYGISPSMPSTWI